MLKTYIDQMGQEVRLEQLPRRIISLVPSQTELLFDLGLEEEIVGITKFCIHPKDKCKSKVKTGGTKQFNFDLIDTLSPDFIIGNKEENYKEGIDRLKEKYPVWMSDIDDLESALRMIADVGELMGKTKEATSLIDRIQENFSKFTPRINRKALYLIWRNPYMVVGTNTFIHHMMLKCGFDNAAKDHARYPVVSIEEIIELNPEVILLSSEPYPFKEKHIEEFQQMVPKATIILVDGEMFSWAGSRLQHTPDYFEKVQEQLRRTLKKS